MMIAHYDTKKALQNIGDLIVDLLHLAQREGHEDLQHLLEKSMCCYLEEVEEAAALASLDCLIAGPLDDDGATLYWSNTDGWVSLPCATLFTAAEAREGLPIGGRWIAP